MQITLSDHTAALALQQAELAGYGNDVSAYVAHLVTRHDTPPAGVPSPRTREELVAVLQEGIDSGISARSWEEMMQDLRDKIASRLNGQSC